MAVNQPNLEGQIQFPSGGSGGSGGGGAQPSGTNLLALTSTGGLAGVLGVVLIFALSPVNVPCGYEINPFNFVCEEACEYDFKIEEVEVYRQPTVTGVIFRYRDLGQGNIVSYIKGNVLGQAVISPMVTTVVGGANDGLIKTAKADFKWTAEAPQLVVIVPAGQGPVSLTKVLVEISHGDAPPI